MESVNWNEEFKKKTGSGKHIKDLDAAYLRQREKASERRKRFFSKFTPEMWEMKRAKDREYYYKKKEEKKKKALAQMLESGTLEQKRNLEKILKKASRK